MFSSFLTQPPFYSGDESLEISSSLRFDDFLIFYSAIMRLGISCPSSTPEVLA